MIPSQVGPSVRVLMVFGARKMLGTIRDAAGGVIHKVLDEYEIGLAQSLPLALYEPSLADKLSSILVFMADKEETTTETIVQQFGFTTTTAKRYLRQLTEFGYLAAKGGNRNRTYIMLNPSQIFGK